jgi:hypothetical protein
MSENSLFLVKHVHAGLLRQSSASENAYGRSLDADRNSRLPENFFHL